MNLLLPIFAELAKPGIFGKVSPRDPTIYDNPWFWVAFAAALVLLATAIGLVIRRRREKRIEKARKDPVYILRLRLELLRSTADQPGTAFFTELASLLRSAIGLSFEMSATPRTARELEQLLVGRECADRAGAALVVIRECESALFSGDEPKSREDVLIRTMAAFNQLLPDNARKFKEGSVRL